MTLAANTKLGRYEIRSKIGEGGMGEVYRARDTQLSREVAIKVLPAAFSADGERSAELDCRLEEELNPDLQLAPYKGGTDATNK